MSRGEEVNESHHPRQLPDDPAAVDRAAATLAAAEAEWARAAQERGRIEDAARRTRVTGAQDRPEWPEHVRRLVDNAPPLAPDQIARLRVLLAPPVQRLTEAYGRRAA